MNYLTLMLAIVIAVFLGHRLNNMYVNIVRTLQEEYRVAKKQKALRQEKSNFQIGFVYCEKEYENNG